MSMTIGDVMDRLVSLESRAKKAEARVAELESLFREAIRVWDNWASENEERECLEKIRVVLSKGDGINV